MGDSSLLRMERTMPGFAPPSFCWSATRDPSTSESNNWHVLIFNFQHFGQGPRDLSLINAMGN